MAEISVQRFHWRQWSELASTWERIHSSSADASFFLSREWVDCWLATFGEDLKPDLLTFVNQEDVIGCCLLVWRTEWVRGIPLRRVYLNCAGEDDADSTCIEYNSVLSFPGYADQVAEALGNFLRNRGWDELLLQGMVEHSPICTVASSLGSDEISIRPSHYCDFRQIRINDFGFDSALSSNTRRQIQRSQRLYEQQSGPCSFRVACTAQEASEIFVRLIDLHQLAWKDRGLPGAFASPQFTRFHRRLIQVAIAQNRIILMEVRAGSETIGALYGFLHYGKVYFYQSGFRYAADARLKPGLLTHYLAIRYCLDQPALNEYDFLAGDSQYKRSLATASRPLRWIVVRRVTLPSLLFRGLRRAARLCRSHSGLRGGTPLSLFRLGDHRLK
jgi:hypothetical protein